MILDTSAIMAIVLDEPESEIFLRTIASSSVRRMSVCTWIELGVVVQRWHPTAVEVVDQLLRGARVVFEPSSVEQGKFAREAYRVYGQASSHPARLNFGDCFAYALAKATGEPLLFKGDAFAHTDVTAAA